MSRTKVSPELKCQICENYLSGKYTIRELYHILRYRRMASWINHFNHTNYSKTVFIELCGRETTGKISLQNTCRSKARSVCFGEP